MSDPVSTNLPGDSAFVETNGITLHVREAGPETGDPVVLLHGFPEFWYGWHAAIAPLVNDGYRVLVPDQRGYNLSDKPDRVAAYQLPELAADVRGLIDAYGYDQAAVVGHDWGGVVGWWIAIHDPELLSSFVPVNAPHPSVVLDTLRGDPTQLLRTPHVLFFQLPAVPEAVSRAFDWRLPVAMMRESARPGTFTRTDFRRYREAWERDEAFRTMLHWYRANARDRPVPDSTRVEVPLKLLWGTRDRFLKRQLATDSIDYCADGRLSLFSDATHWIQHEQPRKVSSAVIEELAPEPD